MPQKKDANIKHPKRSYLTLTAKEARERKRQKQRDKRAQCKLKRTAASLSAIDVAYTSNTAKGAFNSIAIPFVVHKISRTNQGVAKLKA
jgi:hypothetical protein